MRHQRRTLSQLKDKPKGTEVDTLLATGEGEVRTTSKGDKFIDLPLYDLTGSAEGRIWETEECPVGDNCYVHVVGETNFFKGTFQITVDKIDEVHESNVAKGAFQTDPSDEDYRRGEELIRILKENIQDEEYKQLCLEALDIAGEDLLVVPAAEKMHHEEKGGLLRHKLSMVRLAPRLATHYDVDKDLTVAGCLFHDIGKVMTFSPLFKRTADENRIGHIIRGCEILNRAAMEVDVADSKIEPIKHIIASHHKEKEWGSPVEPQEPIAYLVHLIDQLDSTMDGET